MTRNATTRRRRATRGPAPQGVARVLTCTALGSAGLVTALLTTAARTDTALGAPGYWAWVLTGLQVAALWAAGVGHTWGWPLGAAVQPAWIAYAFVTAQVGFVPGCVVSGAVLTANFVREARRGSGGARRGGPRSAQPPAPARVSTAPRPLARFEA